MDRPRRRKQIVVNCIALVMFLASAYLAVITWCLVAIGTDAPAQPNEGGPAWRLLTAISLFDHHWTAGQGQVVMDAASPGTAAELRKACGAWPWEQVAVINDGNIVTVHVIGTTSARAQHLAQLAHDHLTGPPAQATHSP